MKTFWIYTTAGPFEVDERTARSVRAQFDADAPDPFVTFDAIVSTLKPDSVTGILLSAESVRTVEMIYESIVGFAETSAE